jgi:transcription factor SPT20
LAGFINAIDAGKMSPDLMELFEDIPCNYYDGCLIVEIRDFRHLATAQTPPIVRRVLLQPDAESITSDIEQICQEHGEAVLPDPIILEQKILVRSVQPTSFA